MPGQEALLAHRREGADEGLERVAEPEAEEVGGLLDAADAHHRFAPVALRLGARRVRQRQEPRHRVRVRPLPGPDVVAHDRHPAGEAVLRDEPVVDALGGVPLLPRGALVGLQPGVDDRHDRVEHRARLPPPQVVAPGDGPRPGDGFAHDAPPMVQVAGDGPHALVVTVVGPPDRFDLLHRQHPSLPPPLAARPARVAGCRSGGLRSPRCLRLGWAHFAPVKTAAAALPPGAQRRLPRPQRVAAGARRGGRRAGQRRGRRPAGARPAPRARAAGPPGVRRGRRP